MHVLRSNNLFNLFKLARCFLRLQVINTKTFLLFTFQSRFNHKLLFWKIIVFLVFQYLHTIYFDIFELGFFDWAILIILFQNVNWIILYMKLFTIYSLSTLILEIIDVFKNIPSLFHVKLQQFFIFINFSIFYSKYIS